MATQVRKQYIGTKSNVAKRASVSKEDSLYNKMRGYGSRSIGFLSRIGKALLFPIAVLPIAAILLRLGAAVPAFNEAHSNGATDFSSGVASFISNSGEFVFKNLHLLFATGVAFGLTRDNRGEAALVGLLGILLLTVLMNGTGKGAVDLSTKIYGGLDLQNAPLSSDAQKGFHQIFTSDLNNVDKDVFDDVLGKNVLAGFAAGGLVAYLYNRYNNVKLPSVLGFFSGRRLIPVLGILSIMVFTLLWAIVFPWVGYVLFLLSDALSTASSNRFGRAGVMGVYAIFNRLLIPFGLHHIPNTLFWFTLDAKIVNPDGAPVFGDINGFIRGISEGNTSGTFQTGFFPIMMFGLPAMVGAFWYTSEDKVQRRRVISLMGSAALISFLTGITEPIEFAFLFIAPALFGLHALLSGLFAFITGLFGIQLGFGFSAGLLDYGLSLPKSLSIISANKTGIDAVFANPGWVWPIGLVTGATYFGLSTWFIKHFNIGTPGRGKGRIEADEVDEKQVTVGGETTKTVGALSTKAAKFVKALGGYENITNFQNCTTRLRYDVKSNAKIDPEELTKAGAKGVVKVGKNHIQIVVGLDVEALNNEIVAGRPPQSS